jgi:hypothetical protein
MKGDPDVIVHVGLHKCGSTWLQKSIFSREDYGLCTPWGEMSHMAVTEFVDVDPMCFDASATRRKYDDALTGVQQDSNIAIVSHEALSSRPHHGKYYAPLVAQRLKDVFPKARLLLIFREQSRIIYSLYGEHVTNGGRHTFAEFLGTGAEPPGWTPLCKLSFFEYDRLIGMYRDVFGAENVLALPLELLKSQPDVFSGQIFDFMGLPAHPIESESRINQGWGAVTVELYRATNGLVRSNPLGPQSSRAFKARQFIAWKLDRIIPDAWNTPLEQRRRAFLKNRIGTTFSDSNARLSDMLDLDLKPLGYT